MFTTINLEKELLKTNKTLLNRREQMLIEEYKKHSEIADNEVLTRIGLNQTFNEGKSLENKTKNLKEETKRFNQERVFHISQIKKICNDYYLKFLPISI